MYSEFMANGWEVYVHPITVLANKEWETIAWNTSWTAAEYVNKLK